MPFFFKENVYTSTCKKHNVFAIAAQKAIEGRKRVLGKHGDCATQAVVFQAHKLPLFRQANGAVEEFDPDDDPW